MKAALLPFCCASLLLLMSAAFAHDQGRPRYETPPPAPVTYYYGPVTNYYGPVTVNSAPAQDYGPDYPSAPPSYGAPVYPGGYGAGYDYGAYNSGPYGSDYGYGYPYASYPYNAGYGMQPPAYDPARLDPWNGYNWGPGNGYW